MKAKGKGATRKNKENKIDAHSVGRVIRIRSRRNKKGSSWKILKKKGIIKGAAEEDPQKNSQGGKGNGWTDDEIRTEERKMGDIKGMRRDWKAKLRQKENKKSYHLLFSFHFPWVNSRLLSILTTVDLLLIIHWLVISFVYLFVHSVTPYLLFTMSFIYFSLMSVLFSLMFFFKVSQSSQSPQS